MTINIRVFISSKMLELAEEREAVLKFLPTLDYGDITIRAWVYEHNVPASENSIREIYLENLKTSNLIYWSILE